MWGFSENPHTVPECYPAPKDPLLLSVGGFQKNPTLSQNAPKPKDPLLLSMGFFGKPHTVPEGSLALINAILHSVGECGGFSIKPPHSPTLSKITIWPLKRIIRTVWGSVGECG